MDRVSKIKRALNLINFDGVLKIDSQSVEEYSFTEYMHNGREHKINGFCTLCENAKCNSSTEQGFSLQTIGHGAHSIDFLEAFTNKVDTTAWCEEGVLFLFESPSVIHDFYSSKEFNGVVKHPSCDWFFVHDRFDNCSFPQFFKGGEYGRLFASIITTFKLKNAYMTDIVKCGLNNEKGAYKNIEFMHEETRRMCYDTYTRKEIEILSPAVIFAFGSAGYRWIKELTGDIPIFVMPHPAGAQRGFRNTFYNTLYFWLIAKGLYQVGLITDNEINGFAKKYVSPETNPF